MKSLRNLSCAGALLALALFVVTSCGGGGGGGPVTPGNPQPTTSVRDAVRPTADGVAFWANLYRSIDDTTPLEDGSEFKLYSGESVNFSAKSHADLLQVDGSYKTEEITMIPGMKFTWAFRGLDEDNAGMTGKLETSLSQVTIAYEDLPAGGRYDLSVRAEIAPQDLVNYVNQRLQQARAQNPPSNGGGSGNDDAIWAGVGVLVGLLICPSDSAGVILVSVPGITPPPPTNHPPTIDPNGPTTIEIEAVGTWSSGASDPDGDHLTYLWYVDGTVQSGGVAVINPSIVQQFHTTGTHTIRFVVNDGNGGTNSYTWTIQVTTIPPTRVLDHISVAPAVATILVGATQQFTAVAYDQNGVIIYDNVHPVWSVVNGGGTISNAGLFTAGQTAGTFSQTVRIQGTYNDVAKYAYATVTVQGQNPPNQVLVAFPASVVLQLGESQEFQFWLKDVQTGSLVRRLDNSTMTQWSVDPPLAVGEEYVLATFGVFKTWKDSGPPDYTILTYMTPGQYNVTAMFGELVVTIPVTINFASGG